MKGSLKYILLFVVACICSIAIYYIVTPGNESSDKVNNVIQN